MKKYYIGLLAIALLTLGLIIFVAGKGMDERQDKVTQKKVTEISQKLNSYVSKNKKIPQTLKEAGVDNIPGTIKYEKVSATTYKFCATFKKKSSYAGAPMLTSLIWGGGVQSTRDDSQYDYYSDSNDEASSLYMYSHKEGENCQTVKPYQIAYSYYDNSYYSPPVSDGSASSKVQDTERQSDIKSIHAQLEAYYAQNGLYPSYKELNSQTWRSTNMKGLASSSLKDPGGASTLMASKPAKNIYSYEAVSSTGASCDNSATTCTAYTLTATLSDGSEYTKLSLN